MDTIEASRTVLVSPITFFEIAQKVRLGKWTEMAPFINRLPALLMEQGGGIAALEPEFASLRG
jgi:PIN domain nuclease of toxin-antitoxin system